MNYVSWFITLFFIASFMRLRMNALMERRNSSYTLGGLVFFLIVDIFSIAVISYGASSIRFWANAAYLFTGESSMLLPLLTGIMAFVVFKKMRLRYIPIINILGGPIFGVFLIHTRGDTMRRWLWKDFLHNVEMYHSSRLALHAVGSVLAIFIVCIAIDRMRIRFVEPYLVVFFDRLWTFVVKMFKSIEKWITRKTSFLIGE